ncbi:MAG: 4Fe-4S dicluster domain-containing protein [Candidatus Omnitrophica bacterium]|nr:4Fe-4S dicluster domain-containing protein [Candidatus Omnitrophota bacterium]
MKYISFDNFKRLLDVLKDEYSVYVPVKSGEKRFFKRYQDFTEDIVIAEARTVEPAKAFFSRAREVVAEGFKDDVPYAPQKPFAIVGVKACDLKGFKVQDFVFKDHDYQDPFYMKAREENLIISADCSCAIDTCFCLALGLEPHPTEDFDLNLSQIKGGFLVDVGSQRGEALIEKQGSLFEDEREGQSIQREEQRQRVAKAVEDNIKMSAVPRQDRYKGVVEKKFESKIWEDEAKTCVECGACNTICPTCHCFLLYDQKDEQRMARLRIWDSCMIKDFARVAGGANPRGNLWMRLRNRFEKKFDYFPKVADIYACTGCGRCISACPAKIDIRKVLKKLVNDA